MHCPVCNSDETVFVAAHADSAVSGGLVYEWQCLDCGHVYQDVPHEVADEVRDRKMTDNS